MDGQLPYMIARLDLRRVVQDPQCGEERLLEVLGRVQDRPPQEVAAAILEAVQVWGDFPEAHDDMTLLVARRV